MISFLNMNQISVLQRIYLWNKIIFHNRLQQVLDFMHLLKFAIKFVDNFFEMSNLFGWKKMALVWYGINFNFDIKIEEKAKKIKLFSFFKYLSLTSWCTTSHFITLMASTLYYSLIWCQIDWMMTLNNLLIVR